MYIEKDDSLQDLEGFNRFATQMELNDDLRAVIGHFLADFALFESMQLTALLKVVSSDPELVEHLPELMSLEHRLKLLKYLAGARNLPQALKDDIKAVSKAANDLRVWRDEVAHGAAVLSTPLCTDVTNPDTLAGVLCPRSKRVVPHTLVDDPMPLHRSWMLSTEVIRALILPVRDLQRSSGQLVHKLQCHRHGEPWQPVVVTQVAVPKLPDQ